MGSIRHTQISHPDLAEHAVNKCSPSSSLPSSVSQGKENRSLIRFIYLFIFEMVSLIRGVLYQVRVKLSLKTLLTVVFFI